MLFLPVNQPKIPILNRRNLKRRHKRRVNIVPIQPVSRVHRVGWVASCE